MIWLMMLVLGAPLNVDGLTACPEENAIEIFLERGRYLATPIEDEFVAENAWGGQVEGCDENGTNCTKGWSWDLSFRVPGGDAEVSAPHKGYADPYDALLFAEPFYVRVPVDGVVKFWNHDTACDDNVGGFSFMLDRAVPTKQSSWSEIKSRF